MPLARLRLLSLLLAATLATATFPAAAPAELYEPAEKLRRIKRAQQQMLMMKAQAKLAKYARAAARAEARAGREARDYVAARAERFARRAMQQRIARGRAGELQPAATGSATRRPSVDLREPGTAGPEGAAERVLQRAQSPAQPTGAPPTNVLVNTRAGDAPGDGQAEQDLAVQGNNVLVAWNDGSGFALGGDTQGYGYSTNGGASFTDGGVLPKPAGFPSFVWTSDPVITLNEATGTFYYVGLCSPTSTTNGIGIIPGTFGGGTFTWGTPSIVRSVSNVSAFLDKPWVVADSSNGNVYVSYTEFFPGGDEIRVTRSTNGGTAWDGAGDGQKISAAFDDGLVQGSRPVVGPGGEVYVFWYTIGQLSAQDLYYMRASTNDGVSYGAQQTAATMFANFGTGAPGFNREMGIQFPSVSVDRTTGPNRGRIYLAWNESVDWFNDPLGGTGAKSEVESNDSAPTASAFVPGWIVRGNLSNSAVGEFDWFSFTANAGQTYIFWADSLPAGLLYTMRIFCTDQTSRLAFGGQTLSAGFDGFITWTAPTSGTYYLRMANLNPIGGGPFTTGGYRILTGTDAGGTGRARDHRDVYVASSSNGGVSWTTPNRVNVDPPRFDNWLPEVEVGGNGAVYVIWYDFSDALSSCGALSHVYLAVSETAGNSWNQLGAVTTLQSDWTNAFSNIAPNQGDYLALYADDMNLYPCWADARNGDPDVFMSVWSLASTPVLLSLASASAEPDRVRLQWHTGGDPLASATVHRRTESTDWQTLAVITPDGSDLLHFVDEDVTPGARYGYRLSFRDGDADRFSAEVWVDVPDAFRLAISGIRPNPARGDAVVSFSLPSPGPARMQVLDVAGRVVRTIDVGSFGAGNHQLNLGNGAALPAGVYMVRLLHDGRSVSERLSVVR